MNNASRLFMMALATSAVGFTASAAVLFQDDFEANAVGTVVGSPPIGQSWTDGSTGGPPLFGADAITVVSSPAKGTRSLKFIRPTTTPNPDLKGISLPGAILDGNIVEVKWSHNHEGAHNFNNPSQISIGQVGSVFNNNFMFITTLDAGNGHIGYYTGPGQFGNLVDSGVTISRNTEGANEGKWDDYRAVLTLSQLNATQMSGTMDLFVKINGGAEVQLANDALLSTTDLTGADPTSMQFHIAKGAYAFTDHYDDVSIEVIGVVPEPTALAGLAGVALMGLRRRKS